MKHLDLYDVLAVAARVLECDPAAAIRRTELDVVDAVLREVAELDDVVDAAGGAPVGAGSRVSFQRVEPPGQRRGDAAAPRAEQV